MLRVFIRKHNYTYGSSIRKSLWIGIRTRIQTQEDGERSGTRRSRESALHRQLVPCGTAAAAFGRRRRSYLPFNFQFFLYVWDFCAKERSVETGVLLDC